MARASATVEPDGQGAAAESGATPEFDLGRRELNRVRARYLQLRDQRLDRIKASLQREQRQFLELLPLLFHVNHPLLPGFVDTHTPAGVADYAASRQELLLARRHARSLAARRGRGAGRVIRGLYLMGSLGSLGQDRGSDLDIWLCHDAGLNMTARAALRAKIAGIEAWGSSLGLQVHIFPVQAEAFREGLTLPLSDESSGRLGRHLLLEEFYRTGVLLAGLMPVWWLIPAEHEAEYSAYAQRLQTLRLVPRKRWLDFGGLDAVPPHEFYSAARWQLHKSIAAPYKALLKLMLSEAYVADYPRVDWVALRIKRALFGRQPVSADHLDPYRLILERITEHLRRTAESGRLELARRAFYVKAGQQLSRPSACPDWRRLGMEALVHEWRWRAATRREMDAREHWKLDRVLEERNALVAELSRGLRLLGDFARTHAASPGLDARELSLLGRKLYATLERRPGKIDRVNPGISPDLSEPLLWLVHETTANTERWLLYRNPPGPTARPAKAAAGLVELLAWLHVNGLADQATHLQLVPPPADPHLAEHLRLLKVLQRQLPPSDTTPGTMEAFNSPAQVQKTLVFLDIGRDRRDDDPRPLRHLDQLSLTSWGEILVQRRYGGLPALLDVLCEHLDARPFDHPAAFEVHGLTATRTAQLAARVTDLAQTTLAWLASAGPDARYLLRLEERLYLIGWQDQRCRWVEVGDRGQLLELLGESSGRFRPTRMDPQAWPESPLALLLEHNRQDVIQVYYRVHTAGIDVWVLDDLGALFQQHLPQAWEPHFLAHQHRFFDTLLVRRLLHGAVSAAGFDQALCYHRLSRGERGWRLHEVPLPAQPGPYLELLLVTGPAGAGGHGHRLICGDQEFDALVLGEAFYATVADAVLRRRRSGGRYPIYITGVQPAETGTPWSVCALLRIKRALEHRLNAAIGLHGPQTPAL